LLPLSDFTIILSKSKDYLRCALLLHLVTMVVLVRSGLPFMMKLFLGLLLAISLITIIRNKLPLPNYEKLSYHPGYWLLHEVNGRQTKYEHASVGFEGGIFILLNLTGISPRKILVIFKDQITVAQYRILKFID
jgi:hypothetical protein